MRRAGGFGYPHTHRKHITINTENIDGGVFVKIELSFLDGTTREVELVRPPRYVFWRHGRSAKIFSHRVNEIMAATRGEDGKPGDPEEQGIMLLGSMEELEAIKLQAFADDVVRHSLKPQVKVDELTEISYWKVFAHRLYSKPDTPVETEEGETDIKTVETFCNESPLSPHVENMQDVLDITV